MRVAEGWDSFSEDFTPGPDHLPGAPGTEEFWAWHVTYGLSAGFPLCCVLHWTRWAAKRTRRARNDIGLRFRDGVTETGQHFVACPRDEHEETYQEWKLTEHDFTAYLNKRGAEE